MSFVRRCLSNFVGIIMVIVLFAEQSAALFSPLQDNGDDFSSFLLEEEKEGSTEGSSKGLSAFLDELMEGHEDILFVHALPVQHYSNWFGFVALHNEGKIHPKESRVLISIPHPLLYLLFHNFKVDFPNSI